MAMNAGPDTEPTNGSADEVPEEERLACGRALGDVWRQWEEGGADPHTRTCPHCAAALHELDTLKDVVRHAQSGQSVPQDTGQLVERVMDVVRVELRPGRTLPLGSSADDDWIVEAAAAKVLRQATDSLPGVRAGSCRITPSKSRPTTSRRKERGPVSARIEVVIALTENVPETAERVRACVLAAADQVLGLEVDSVDVAVVDLLDDEIRTPGGPWWR